jgi:hypothetical protein
MLGSLCARPQALKLNSLGTPHSAILSAIGGSVKATTTNQLSLASEGMYHVN